MLWSCTCVVFWGERSGKDEGIVSVIDFTARVVLYGQCMHKWLCFGQHTRPTPKLSASSVRALRSPIFQVCILKLIALLVLPLLARALPSQSHPHHALYNPQRTGNQGSSRRFSLTQRAFINLRLVSQVKASSRRPHHHALLLLRHGALQAAGVPCLFCVVVRRGQ